MAENDIIFFCTECGTQLAVAAELAGVEGPCPACDAQIKAPELVCKALEPELRPMPILDNPLFPKMIGVPRQTEINLGLDDVATCEEGDAEVDAGQDEAKELPVLTDDEVKEDASPHALEPLLVPLVSERRSDELPEIWIKDDPEPSSWYAKPWVWGMLAVVVAMVVLLVDVFKSAKEPVPGAVMPVRSSPTGVSNIVKPEIVKPELPKVDPPTEPVLVKLKALPPQFELEEVIEPKPKMPEPLVDLPPIKHPLEEIIQVKTKSAARLAIEEKLQGLDAQQILDLFLNVKTLDERVPLMLSKAASDELEQSCLARSMPPVARIELDYRDVNAETGVTDSYFTVLFNDSTLVTHPQTLLVRQQGDGPAKVVVDSFLDLYGGRLMSFVGKPVQSAKTFEVYVSALAHCKDSEIPGCQSKMTLSLQARDHGAELAKAYFDKKSQIATLLEDGTFRLSYGSPTPCKVLLRWNVGESPGRPYLEAVEIKAFGWGTE